MPYTVMIKQKTDDDNKWFPWHSIAGEVAIITNKESAMDIMEYVQSSNKDHDFEVVEFQVCEDGSTTLEGMKKIDTRKRRKQ